MQKCAELLIIGYLHTKILYSKRQKRLQNHTDSDLHQMQSNMKDHRCILPKNLEKEERCS